ncbi:Yip1 family protein [Undibacterium fentianense]|uniref:YIP1 family protein n=1 Tax=Undibacterium fentianense TaxID=2828728 RepID=A0A941E2J5_9BURK|nr:Yip1 family protein [Undibacterium fentianense]MBR7799887.1 YIP1 family protein [Undibacterium fentianense]
MSTNAFTVLMKLFYEPSAAFASLKENSKPWIPLILMMGSTLGLFYWYYATVDFSWLIDHTLSAKPDMKPEEREMVTKIMSKNSMLITTMGGVLIGMPLFYAVHGLYLLLASKVMDSALPYGKWFNFAVWSSVPSLIGAPLMALQILTGHGQVSMEGLNMLSFNFLLTNFPPDHPWVGIMNSLSVPMFWSIFISFVGLRIWTGRKLLSCAVVAVLPYAVIYGLWMAKLVFFK